MNMLSEAEKQKCLHAAAIFKGLAEGKQVEFYRDKLGKWLPSTAQSWLGVIANLNHGVCLRLCREPLRKWMVVGTDPASRQALDYAAGSAEQAAELLETLRKSSPGVQWEIIEMQEVRK